MPRPKEFDPEVALKEAVKIFCDTGYQGTSTDDLLEGMGISRQSMYDTFGDKRALYLEALRHYITERVANKIRILSAEASSLKGLEAVLRAEAIGGAQEGTSGCMGLGAVAEFGQSDHEIASLIGTTEKTFLSAVQHRIAEGKARGEISAGVDTLAGAEFITAMLAAIKLAARGGASPQTLRNIARMALRSLK